MALGGNSKTLQAFAMTVGINLDDKDAIERATLLAKELKNVFASKLKDGNTLFNYSQEFRNIKQLTDLINKIGNGSKKPIFSDSDSSVLERYVLSFKNLNDSITTATVNLKEFNRIKSAANTGEIIESGNPEVSTTVSDKTELSSNKQNNALYNKSLSLLQDIHSVKLKLITADEKSSLLLKDQLSTLQKELSTNINRTGKSALTSTQSSNLGVVENNNTSQEQAYQKIVTNEEKRIALQREQQNLENQLSQSLNYQVTLHDKINSLNLQGRTSEANAYSDILSKEKQRAAFYSSEIKDEETKLNLGKQYAENLSVINAREKDNQKKQDTGEDNKTIQQTIKLYQQLTEERIKLNKLQSQGANDVVIKQNQEALSELESSYKKISSTILKDNSIVSDNAKVVKNVTDEDRKLVEAQNGVTKGVSDSTVHVNGFNSTLTSMIKNVFQYRIASTAFQQVDQAILASVQKVKTLDDSMTQIRLVTGGTSEDAQKMIGTYADLAVQLHTTTQAVAEGSVEWLRQGKTVEDTATLLKSSTVLSKVGMMDSAQATELMTASLNGFKLEAKDAMGVVDKFAALDLKYATSAEEIATALKYVASSAGIAGIGIDKMSALITIASQTTRLSAENIGNAFKSITARMQNIKVGKFIDDDTSEQLNDVEKVLNKLGIKLRDSKDSWRNMEDVLDEVGVKWQSYTDIEKSALATSIAGTRQRNIFIATMENYDKVLQATTVSATSAGTAQEKYSAITDSIDGKLNNLTSTWDKLVNNLNQSGNFKGVIDLGTKLVGVLDFSINKLHLLSAALILVGGKLFGLGLETVVSKFSNIANTTNGLIVTLGKLSTATIAQDVATKSYVITTGTETLNLGKLNQAQILKTINDNKELAVLKTLTVEQVTQVLTRQGVNAEIAKDTALKLVNNVATEGATVATGGLTTVMNGLNAAMKANPIGFWVGLITTIASIAVPMFQSLANSEQDAINKSKELLETFANQKSTLDSNTKIISDNTAEYAKLKQGVNGLNENVKLSSDEYTKFLELNKQIANASPDLVKGYDAQGNALLNLSGNAQEVTNQLTEMVKQQKLSYNQDIVKDSDSIWNGISLKVEDYKKQISDIGNIQKTISGNSLINEYEFNKAASYLDKIGVKYKQIIKVAETGDGTGFGYKFDFGNIDVKNIINKIDNLKVPIQKELDKEMSKIQPVIQANVELDDNYKKLGSQLQSVINKSLSGMDLSKAGKTPQEIQNYIKKNIIDPIYNSSPAIQTALDKALNLQSKLSNGGINKSQFKTQVTDLFKDAFKGIDVGTLKVLQDSLANAGVKGNGLIQMFTNLVTPSNDVTKSIADQTEALDTLGTTITTIVDKYNGLGDIIDDINTYNTISSDDMSKIIKDYSDLTPALLQYSAGLKSTSDIVTLLKAKQKEQSDAYKKNVEDNLASDTTFYSQKMAKESSLTKELLNTYQIRVADYSTFNDLKKAIDESVMNYKIGLNAETGTELADTYLADATNYGQFEKGKQSISDVVQMNIRYMNKDQITALGKQYGVDVSNFGDNEEAKAKIAAEVSGKIVQIYAQTNAGFATTLQAQLAAAQANVGTLASKSKKDAHSGELYAEAQAQVEGLQNALKALNGSVDTNGVQNQIDKILNSINTKIPDTNKGLKETAKDAKDAETAAKKSAAALKAQYEAELKIIEANKGSGKYDKDKMSYYNALNSLQSKWAKSALDTVDKQELQAKVYGALKDYQDGILKDSYAELQNREDTYKIAKDSSATLQNLLEIQKNLLSKGMSLANTAENRLELEKKILDVKRAIAKSEQDELAHEVSMGNIKEDSIEYIQKLQSIYKKLNSSNLADKSDLWSLQEKIYDAEKSYTEKELTKQQNAIQKKIDGYKKQQDAIEKTYQKQIDADESEIKSLNKKEDALENLYKPQIDAIDAQTKALSKQETAFDKLYQPQIDALQKIVDEKEAANNATNKAIELEKAKEALLTAQTQKTNRIYKQGQGFVWEADKTAISDAKKNLDDLNYQAEIDALNAQKDKLQKTLDSEKKSLENQIETLNDYKDTLQDTWDSEKKVLDSQIKVLTDHKDNLKDILDSEKASIQNQIDSLEDYKDKWDDLLTYYKDNTDEFMKKMTNNNINEVGLLKARLNNYTQQNSDFLGLFTSGNDSENDLLLNRESLYSNDNGLSLSEYKQRTDNYKSNQQEFLKQLSDGNSKESELLSKRLSNLDSFRINYANTQSKIVSINSGLITSNNNLASSYKNAADKASEYISSLSDVANAKLQNSTGYAKVHGAFKDGGVDTSGGLNMLHGTPTSPEVIFNATDSKKLYDVVHNNNNLSQYFTRSMEEHNSKITTNNDKNIEITIGDVNLHEVQNANETAKAIVEKLPASILKEMYRKGA